VKCGKLEHFDKRRIDVEQTLNARRRYLTENELEKLIKAGRKGRYGRRDATLMLLMARHGLRVTEAADLRWDQIDFSKGHLHVRRLKGGIHSVHPIQGDELRALRELRREQQPESAFVFTTERGGPMTRSNVAKIIGAAGDRAGLPHCHPHQLRHTCGHLLADAGHDNRTGVLIFVSLAEHYARIIADDGIAQKVHHSEWQAAIDALTARMHDDQITAGFIAAIQRCGDVLATHAPPDGSSNELPDRLYVI
jgi:hypothetical protein